MSQILSAVHSVRDRYPAEHIYGAMFHDFYGDGTVMTWPTVTVGTEESLAGLEAGYDAEHGDASINESLRWSGPDLAHGFDPGEAEEAIAEHVNIAACRSGDFQVWQQTYARFLQCFPKAAKQACRQLLAEGVITRQFIAVAIDETSELVKLSLSKTQLQTHFPQHDLAEQERRRLAGLPVEQRVTEVLAEAVAPSFQKLLSAEYEALLVQCGAAALPGLVRVVRGQEHRPGAVTAARLLAQINIDTPEVIAALDALMRSEDEELTARSWAASALARMGRSDLILTRVRELPAEVVATGITNPFRSFRDRGAFRSLDYGPLETVLREHPHLEPTLEKNLKPGVGYCALRSEEIPVAQAALASPWNVIRTHARIALEDAGTISS